jgi:hypothetical protein
VDLPQIVARELSIDPAQAERGLGAVFMSIRMAAEPATFARITVAFPDADTWMRAIELSSGRTGEILALASPQALRRQLKLAGFSEKHVRQLGPTVGQALQAALPPETFDQVVTRIPLLKGAS